MTASLPSGTERTDRSALADLIDARKDEIVARWTERVRTELPRDVELTQLRDAMPDYLARLSEALRGGGSLAQSGSAVWEDVAREHAITRVRLGFDVRELVREFVVLRQVLAEISREHQAAFDVTQATRVADLIEAAVAVAVGTYVDARDYEARRKQAEHIGFLAHELRSPLTAVRMSAARLRRTVPKEDAEPLDVLERNVQRLQSLIDGVLHAERLEAGKVEPQVADIELGELLDHSMEAARMAADEKGIAFRADYDPKLLVRADQELGSHAIQNLVDNAVKYTDTGGVEVVAETTSDHVTVHVRDTCPGLSHEELKVIFEPFERGRRHGKPGSGLGLAIARRAIETQGGTIGAESPGERGCHFWITLPRSHH